MTFRPVTKQLATSQPEVKAGCDVGFKIKLQPLLVVTTDLFHEPFFVKDAPMSENRSKCNHMIYELYRDATSPRSFIFVTILKS